MITVTGQVHQVSIHNVYLAGEMSGYRWRDQVIEGLPLCEWEPHQVVETNFFNYVGPFFRSAMPTNRSVGEQLHSSPIGNNADPLGVIDRLQERFEFGIKHCTVFLAYIDKPMSFEVLLEIDMALAAKKRVVVCFRPGIDHKPFEAYLHQALCYVNVRPENLAEILIKENDRFAIEAGYV